jgi:hypothetical protein
MVHLQAHFEKRSNPSLAHSHRCAAHAHNAPLLVQVEMLRKKRGIACFPSFVDGAFIHP